MVSDSTQLTKLLGATQTSTRKLGAPTAEAAAAPLGRDGQPERAAAVQGQVAVTACKVVNGSGTTAAAAANPQPATSWLQRPPHELAACHVSTAGWQQSLSRQLAVLTWRTTVDTCRSPSLLLLHWALAVTTGLLMGVIFYQVWTFSVPAGCTSALRVAATWRQLTAACPPAPPIQVSSDMSGIQNRGGGRP